MQVRDLRSAGALSELPSNWQLHLELGDQQRCVALQAAGDPEDDAFSFGEALVFGAAADRLEDAHALVLSVYEIAPAVDVSGNRDDTQTSAQAPSPGKGWRGRFGKGAAAESSVSGKEVAKKKVPLSAVGWIGSKSPGKNLPPGRVVAQSKVQLAILGESGKTQTGWFKLYAAADAGKKKRLFASPEKKQGVGGPVGEVLLQLTLASFFEF